MTSEKKTSSYFVTFVLVGCLLIVVLLTPWIAQRIVYSITLGSEQAKAKVAKELLSEIPDAKSTIPWVVKRVGPSVVGITTHTLLNEGKVDRAGEGSGVIIDKDGYLLTNFHVINGAEAMQVMLSDGRTTDNVQIIGFDAAADVAVLKIDLPDLTAIDWGDSNSLEVGDGVLAIGNPYGFSHTVTSGIISAKERYTESIQKEGFLQTDAAMNPGSSGGPLVDMRGELVGINIAIIGDSFRGISLAIPSNLVKNVYEEIRKHGTITYGWLGIGMEPLNPYYARKMGLSESKGVVVAKIVPNSPASEAGFKLGDVILKFDDKEVEDPTQLSHLIFLTKPGTEITFQIIREQKPEEIKAKLGTRPVNVEKK